MLNERVGCRFIVNENNPLKLLCAADRVTTIGVDQDIRQEKKPITEKVKKGDKK